MIKKIAKGKLPLDSLTAAEGLNKNQHTFVMTLEFISKSSEKMHARYVLACESKFRGLLSVIDG
jgi:hypothetical protein